MVDSYPRQAARTRRFSLGVPRSFTVSADGSRLAFLRSSGGADPQTALWLHDVASGTERLVADPAELGAGGEESAAERALRERRRERAAGIVAFSADAALDVAAFVLAGEAWLTRAEDGGPRRLDLPSGPVFDARLDPSGRRLAWCAGGELWVATADPDAAGRSARRLAGEDDPAVTWGQAEFVAAEEMHRDRGHWWAPDGAGLLVARADVTAVATLWVSDPAHPDRVPVAHRYPTAGTADADVSLWYLAVADDGSAGGRVEVRWDRSAFPYVPAVRWSDGAPLVVVERRDHRQALVLDVDVRTGATTTVAASSDAAWVDWPTGLPGRLADGRPVWSGDLDDTRRLLVDAEPVTPVGLQVRGVHHVGSSVLFTASSEPTEIGLWRWSPDGVEPIDTGGVVVAAGAGGSTVVVARRSLDRAGTTVRVLAGDAEALIPNHAETPVLEPRVSIRGYGDRSLRTGVVMPRDHTPGRRLPVLMAPYGGPGAQMVLADRQAWLDAQWRADQGFAVVVVDGRGTPGRGPTWERTVHRDFATAVLEDQVAALRAVAAERPDLDLGRVGIYGWSFGGYLAALAVLRRPDVFHAAVAGAPVTDWTLYDTYYTERHLGNPAVDPGPYTRSSLLVDAGSLTRPLMLIHGLVDDNVVVAHTLRLSQRLLEHGRPHAVLPLTGVTHMASQEEVAENLMLLQTTFLRDALGA
jgi:dipeptidyl-peptidase-4